MGDNINHPSYYNTGKIEVIEFIEDKQLGFNLGNAIKYICRAGKKNKERTVEDLKKAVWYLEREILTIKKNNKHMEDYNIYSEQKYDTHPIVESNLCTMCDSKNEEIIDKVMNTILNSD